MREFGIMNLFKGRSKNKWISGITAAAMALCQATVFPAISADAAGSDIYVGYPGKSNNYSTVTEALDRCEDLDPSSESERVTIHIAPGTYREQLVVDTPYITFVNDEPQNGDVVLTWYYGIGYKYYSVGNDKRYNASNASSKSAKAEPTQRWGATVQILSTGNDFKAENIVFENSFNRYVTSEEIADGVEPALDTTSINFDRTASGADVTSKAATERAAALAIDGDRAEFLNCEFHGSQDTIYTGSNTGYFKNCLIEGNTDYIFGKGDYVFDECELRFYGYSSAAAGGYITAAREQSKGYLFMNCDITGNPELVVSSGYLGRPWRDTAAVMFINTTIEKAEYIKTEGWAKMSSVEPEAAAFKEYGTKLADGTAVDLSSRRGNVLSDADAATVDKINWFGSWTPTFINASSDSGNTGSDSGNTGGTVSGDGITDCGGWFETGYAEWNSNTIGSDVKVYYKESSAADSAYKQVDSELVRGSRVDIPGMKGNTEYNIKIEGSSGSAVCTVKPLANDRTGYAHWNYSQGVGAYNNDGTLKDGITVIYVTNENKDTITYNGKTGLYSIFADGKPSNVVFRLIGEIDVPAGALANDGTKNDGSHMLYLEDASNVTVEGIGYDTHLVRWGFEMKRSSSIEVRNLYFYQYPDDAVAMNGSSDNMTNHVWIHNNSFGIGLNEYAGNGTVDDDKADGDGTTDMKWSEYITISYNYYNNCHKTSLVGGGTSHYQDWITYHHNWFDTTSSRNPRARVAHIHVLNNYFKDNSDYGIGASYNSKIFSEANYFENTNLPLNMTAMGSDKYSGTIKSYNDMLDGCTGDSVYTAVTSRMDTATISNLVSGGDAYDNFDVDSSKMYLDYTSQSPAEAKTTCIEYAGRMQNKAYGSGSAGGTTGGNDDPSTEKTGAVIDTAHTYKFKNAGSGLYLSVADSVAADGTNVEQSTGGGIEWTVEDAGNGYYKIYSALGDGRTYLLDVAYNAPENGTNIGIWSDTACDAQLFKFVDNGDGTYTICTKTTKDASAIGIESGSTEEGANVVQWECDGSANQKWTLEISISASLVYDATCDGKVNILDLALVKRILRKGTGSFSAQTIANADCNSDGSITMADAVKLQKYLICA